MECRLHVASVFRSFCSENRTVVNLDIRVRRDGGKGDGLEFGHPLLSFRSRAPFVLRTFPPASGGNPALWPFRSPSPIEGACVRLSTPGIRCDLATLARVPLRFVKGRVVGEGREIRISNLIRGRGGRSLGLADGRR